MDSDMTSMPTHPHDAQVVAPAVDSNSAPFINPLNQLHGYYTPNSGNLSAGYRSPAGDLHTPGVGLTMVTPLSLSQQGQMPTSSAGVPVDPFSQQFISPQFQNPQPFAPQVSFAPNDFLQNDMGYDGANEILEDAPMDDMQIQGTRQFPFSSAAHGVQSEMQSSSQKYASSIQLLPAFALWLTCLTYQLPL